MQYVPSWPRQRTHILPRDVRGCCKPFTLGRWLNPAQHCYNVEIPIAFDIIIKSMVSILYITCIKKHQLLESALEVQHGDGKISELLSSKLLFHGSQPIACRLTL